MNKKDKIKYILLPSVAFVVLLIIVVMVYVFSSIFNDEQEVRNYNTFEFKGNLPADKEITETENKIEMYKSRAAREKQDKQDSLRKDGKHIDFSLEINRKKNDDEKKGESKGEKKVKSNSGFKKRIVPHIDTITVNNEVERNSTSTTKSMVFNDNKETIQLESIDVNDDKTIKACAFGRQEVKHEGYFSIRLLKDLKLDDGTIIKKNTRLKGICRLSGNRLIVVFSNLLYEGKYLNFHFEAYDIDGLRGLNIISDKNKELQKDNVNRVGKNRRDNVVGSALSTIDNTGMSSALYQDAVQLAKKYETLTITVDDGYVIYLR